MRIGLVIDTFEFGGAESMIFEIAKLLKGHGDFPILLHFGSPPVMEFADLHEIEQHIIPNHMLYKKMVYLPLFSLKTIHFIKSLQLDCLHSHLFGPIIAFAPLTWLIRLRHVGTLHDVYMIEEKPKRIWLVKLAKFFNTHLVAVSRHMADFYIRSARFKPGSINYVPNFSAANTYGSERALVRNELGLKDDDTVVISVGRLVSLKRFEILIDGASAIPVSNRIKTFIVGDGPERNHLEQKISNNNSIDRITLLGNRQDVERLLAAADIFTLTSETEGMSKAILEALAAGLAVIATDVGGNSDLVIDSVNGYLLTGNDPQEISFQLAKQISELANDKFRLQSMGQKSKLLLQREYTAELFLQRHIALYQNNTASA